MQLEFHPSWRTQRIFLDFHLKPVSTLFPEGQRLGTWKHICCADGSCAHSTLRVSGRRRFTALWFEAGCAVVKAGGSRLGPSLACQPSEATLRLLFDIFGEVCV